MQQGALNPIIVRVVEEPTRETTVADVLTGAVGFVGFVLLAALVVGLIAGGLFILVRKLRARLGFGEDDPTAGATQLTR